MTRFKGRHEKTQTQASKDSKAGMTSLKGRQVKTQTLARKDSNAGQKETHRKARKY